MSEFIFSPEGAKVISFVVLGMFFLVILLRFTIAEDKRMSFTRWLSDLSGRHFHP